MEKSCIDQLVTARGDLSKKSYQCHLWGKSSNISAMFGANKNNWAGASPPNPGSHRAPQSFWQSCLSISSPPPPSKQNDKIKRIKRRKTSKTDSRFIIFYVTKTFESFQKYFGTHLDDWIIKEMAPHQQQQQRLQQQQKQQQQQPSAMCSSFMHLRLWRPQQPQQQQPR